MKIHCCGRDLKLANHLLGFSSIRQKAIKILILLCDRALWQCLAFWIWHEFFFLDWKHKLLEILKSAKSTIMKACLTIWRAISPSFLLDFMKTQSTANNCYCLKLEKEQSSLNFQVTKMILCCDAVISIGHVNEYPTMHNLWKFETHSVKD